jgi:hypothetical protein
MAAVQPECFQMILGLGLPGATGSAPLGRSTARLNCGSVQTRTAERCQWSTHSFHMPSESARAECLKITVFTSSTTILLVLNAMHITTVLAATDW